MNNKFERPPHSFRNIEILNTFGTPKSTLENQTFEQASLKENPKKGLYSRQIRKINTLQLKDNWVKRSMTMKDWDKLQNILNVNGLIANNNKVNNRK